MAKARKPTKAEKVTREVVRAGHYKPGDRQYRRRKLEPSGTRMGTIGKKKLGGRPKGSPNRFPGLLKDALIEAAEYAGRRLPPPKKRGEKVTDLVAYLSHQAIYSPNAFMALLGRVLPLQIEGDGKNIVMIEKIEMVVVDGRRNADQPGGDDEVLSTIEGSAQVLAAD